MGPMRIELAADTEWDRAEQSLAAESLPGLALTSDIRSDSIGLRAIKLKEDTDEETTLGATVVQKAWMQSWLASDSRLDRAVYQIASGSDRVYLQLPEGAEVQSLIIDGVENPPVLAEKDLEIRMARRAGGEHTIEIALRYDTRPPVGVMSFPIPQFRDAQSARQWFWQLLLPNNEHLVLSDSQLTSANRWERRGWLWHRTGSETQPSLEFWTGASTQPKLPESLNQYLFCSFDRVDRIAVRTCERRMLVYGSSGNCAGIGFGVDLFAGTPASSDLAAVGAASAGRRLALAKRILVVGTGKFVGIDVSRAQLARCRCHALALRPPSLHGKQRSPG